MTINDPELYVAGIWDWGFLNTCFSPTRIRVTDLDGFLERNAHFMILETKRKGAIIPTGQAILFRRFVSRGNSVLVIWGHQSDDTHELLVLAPGGDRSYQDATKQTIWDIVHDWFLWADGQRPSTHKAPSPSVTPDELRPFLDRPLSVAEVEEAFVHIRKFNVSVIQGLAGNGRFNLQVVDHDDHR